MSVIAVAAIGVGAAVGFGVVAASIATVATVLTVAAVVGVIGIGLTIAGKVTKNKLLGQIGMVMSMGALGATGGAMGAGALGLGGSAGGWAGATGTTAAEQAAEQAAAKAAGEASIQAAVPSGGAVNFSATQAPGSGVLAPGQVAAQPAAQSGVLAQPLTGPLVAPAAPAPTYNFQPAGFKSGLVLENPGVSTPTTALAGTGAKAAAPGTLTDFFGTPGGATTLVAGVGGVAQMGGGMLQGLGASKAAEHAAKMKEQDLAFERAKWERGNSAVPLYAQTYTKPSFGPTAPTVG